MHKSVSGSWSCSGMSGKRGVDTLAAFRSLKASWIYHYTQPLLMTIKARTEARFTCYSLWLVGCASQSSTFDRPMWKLEARQASFDVTLSFGRAMAQYHRADKLVRSTTKRIAWSILRSSALAYCTESNIRWLLSRIQFASLLTAVLCGVYRAFARL